MAAGWEAGYSPEQLNISHSRGPQKIAASAESSCRTASAIAAWPVPEAASAAARSRARPRPLEGAPASQHGRLRVGGAGRVWACLWEGRMSECPAQALLLLCAKALFYYSNFCP